MWIITACMRMRKLGDLEGQTLSFYVPPEIESKICEHHAYRTNLQIKVADIVQWCRRETILDWKRSLPLWAAQGYRYHDQKALWDQENLESMTAIHAAAFLEQESHTLEQRYRPKSSISTQGTPQGLRQDDTEWARQICARFESVKQEYFNESTLHEEQERELAPQAEEVEQIELPQPANAAAHEVDPDVHDFVATGLIAPGSAAFMPAFESLRDTTAAKHIRLSQLPKDIWVTADFASTVERKGGKSFVSDSYQRPVQWILTSQPTSWDFVVVISPFEAQQLLPSIQASRKTTLHVYAPRPNLEINPLDDLMLFTVPSLSVHGVSGPLPLHLAIQLNLFAGQLYFKSFEEYVETCRMLRLASTHAEAGDRIDADGFLRSATSKAGKKVIRTSTVKKSPVNFLKAFLSKARRDGQGIGKTHLGKVLDGVQLGKKDFDGDEDVEMVG